MSRVVVIGGGPAGMFAAIAAAENGHHVTLLEKNEKLGKKLFITGKGRCSGGQRWRIAIIRINRSALTSLVGNLPYFCHFCTPFREIVTMLHTVLPPPEQFSQYGKSPCFGM